MKIEMISDLSSFKKQLYYIALYSPFGAPAHRSFCDVILSEQ